MKRAAFIALCTVALAAPALAGVLRTERDALLYEMSAERIAHRRSLCATGEAAKGRADLRAAGFQPLTVGQLCVTVLTRVGRDGKLGHVSLANGQTKPTIAFDTGFVDGFLKREKVPKDAPLMAALLPIADRCLGQQETNMRLCTLAGQVLGSRAAQGELVSQEIVAGFEPCSRCNRTGRVTCGSCGGSGNGMFGRCGRCGGSGEATCSSCGGDGGFHNPDSY